MCSFEVITAEANRPRSRLQPKRHGAASSHRFQTCPGVRHGSGRTCVGALLQLGLGLQPVLKITTVRTSSLFPEGIGAGGNAFSGDDMAACTVCEGGDCLRNSPCAVLLAAGTGDGLAAGRSFPGLNYCHNLNFQLVVLLQ